jgi:phospholipid/cholesterol/gamma-HCH transport system substrate-binding protein
VTARPERARLAERESFVAARREIKVGAFVLAGLIATGGVIFMIGEERQLFASKTDYQVAFADVQGLRPGSPVRMGGLDIGTVSKVNYGEDQKDYKIHVTLSIIEAQARRIKTDSIASIEGKGLLGDKMITVTIGSPNATSLPTGSSIRSKEAEDLSQMVSKLGSISVKVEKVVDNLERTTGALADERFHEDVRGTVSSLNEVLGSLERKEGYAGKILSDPAEAQHLSQVVRNLEATTAELQRTTQNVNQILSRVRTGPGLVHELVYGEDSAKAVAQFGGAADELRLALKGMREGNGVARSLIYGDDSSQAFMANLNAASDDFRQIVADLRAGKGTIGALLTDPSVYEDLKMVLGNVERNKALRALVRYSIRRDEASGVTVRDAATPPSGGSATKTSTPPESLAGVPAPRDAESP